MKAGWKRKKLGEVIELISGQHIDANDYNTDGRGVAYLTGPSDFGLVHPVVSKWTEHPKRFAKSGDILLTVKGSGVGKANLLDLPEVAISRQIMAVRAKGIDAKFLSALIHSLQPHFASLANGAAIPGISRSDITDYQFLLPPLEEQRRIVAILDEAFEGLSRARANAEANLQNARELFESFLAREFSENVSSWQTCPLTEHVKFIDYRGKTPPKTEQGIRLITAKNVKMGFIQREPEEFILESAYETWMTRGFPKKGDVLFTTEAPLANVAQLDVDETVVIGQRLITMQPNEKVLLPSFLKFSLMSPSVQKEIHARGTGATVLGIKASLLKTVPISFPRDLNEQRTVAARCQEVYDFANKLAEQFEAKAYELNQLRQSLLQKAFAGELTVREFA